MVHNRVIEKNKQTGFSIEKAFFGFGSKKTICTDSLKENHQTYGTLHNHHANSCRG